ncbi:MAG: hypothetical protein JNK44_03615 [Cyclobacteriaceae bacterium]|nr:hypothetical protein [Cyclobacteriaceae bacterium]
MKRFIGVLTHLPVLLLCMDFNIAQSQNFVQNALLFSSTLPGGSARIQGLGGAQIALGGDFSLAYSNPAGLGMYNRSEFAISAAVNTNQLGTTYFNNADNQSLSKFNIPSLSLVLHTPKNTSGFIGGTFGISLTRTNDFNGSMQYGGENPNTSIIDYFIDQANGRTTSQFDEGQSNFNTPTGLAYYNYLIGPKNILDPPGPNNQYFTDVAGIALQRESITTKGATNQWSISYGGNYNDKIFFGAGVGIATLRYESSTTYSEVFEQDVLFDLKLDEGVSIEGTGFNATLGVTLRPANALQLGASLTTPTYYQLTSVYNAEMYTRWDSFDYYADGSVILTNEFATTDEGGVFTDYSLTTPLKFSTGAAFFLKNGFITADVEFTSPAKAKYGSGSGGFSFSDENAVIETAYQSVVNFRLGGEYRYKIFRFRAGYGLLGNPYQNENITHSNKYWSTGIGLRKKGFFADAAFVSRTAESFYFPYIFSNGYADPVTVKAKFNTIMITAGFSF